MQTLTTSSATTKGKTWQKMTASQARQPSTFSTAKRDCCETHDGFSQSFTEHGMIIGLVNVRADLNHQQGLRKMWSRSTRYDFYFPAFAMLGEQAVLNKEIYVQGTAADNDVFGYQERWAEYRYHPTMITGLFKSTTTALS